jgi:hypothetical protein
VRAVGTAQRFVLWTLLAAIVVNVLPLVYRPLAPYAWVIWLVVPLQLYAIIRLANALQLSMAGVVVCALLMFLPVINLITLVVLNGKATAVLRRANIPVGFMGARESDLPLG